MGLGLLADGPSTSALEYLNGVSLFAVSATCVSMRDLAHNERLWKRACCTDEFGLGATGLEGEEVETLSKFVPSFRKLFAQCLPLRRRLGARPATAWSRVPERELPRSLVQDGSIDFVFVEIYSYWFMRDGGIRRKCLSAPHGRVIRRLDASDVGGFPALVKFPANVSAPGRSAALDPWFEARVLLHLGGCVAPVADTFADDGDSTCRYRESRLPEDSATGVELVVHLNEDHEYVTDAFEGTVDISYRGFDALDVQESRPQLIADIFGEGYAGITAFLGAGGLRRALSYFGTYHDRHVPALHFGSPLDDDGGGEHCWLCSEGGTFPP